jgi:hypothetical protein
LPPGGYPDIFEGMAKKVLVSLDDRLLSRIDAAARREGLTRSAYLAKLAAREVGSGKGPGAASGVKEALGRLDRLFERQGAVEDATRAVRAERDAR